MTPLNDRERRTLRLIEAAIAQADRKATAEEIAAAEHARNQPIQKPQQELELPPAA